MVDAVTGLDNLEWSPEARKQAILADRLVISKTDLAERRSVERLTARLRALNPHASVHIAVDGDLDPRCLIESDSSESGTGETRGAAARRLRRRGRAQRRHRELRAHRRRAAAVGRLSRAAWRR